jgi:cytochrome P450
VRRKLQDGFTHLGILWQLRPGHLEREDLVQVTFLMLVAGNATVASMISLVSVPRYDSSVHQVARV